MNPRRFRLLMKYEFFFVLKMMLDRFMLQDFECNKYINFFTDIETPSISGDTVPQLDVLAGARAAEQGAVLRALRQAQPHADARALGRAACEY